MHTTLTGGEDLGYLQPQTVQVLNLLQRKTSQTYILGHLFEN